MFSSLLYFHEPTCGLRLGWVEDLPSTGVVLGSTPSTTNKPNTNPKLLVQKKANMAGLSCPPCLQNCPLASIWDHRVGEFLRQDRKVRSCGDTERNTREREGPPPSICLALLDRARDADKT